MVSKGRSGFNKRPQTPIRKPPRLKGEVAKRGIMPFRKRSKNK